MPSNAWPQTPEGWPPGAGNRLRRLTLAKVDWQGWVLHGMQLHDCEVDDSAWSSADLTEASLLACRFRRLGAQQTVLSDARIEDCHFDACDLTSAVLNRTRLTDSVFARSLLDMADLRQTSADGCVMRGCSLRGADLRESRFLGGDFRGCDLVGARFADANLRGADFRGALLQGVSFSDAQVVGALFDRPPASSPEPVRTPGAGDAPAIDALLTRLFAPLERRGLQLPPQAALLQALLARANVGETQPQTLLGGLQSVLTATPGAGSEVLQPLLQALQALERGPNGGAGAAAPTEEQWLHMVQTLFPAVQGEVDGDEWERLAQTLIHAQHQHRAD